MPNFFLTIFQYRRYKCRLDIKELKMAMNQVVDAYKQNEINYVEGINSLMGELGSCSTLQQAQ